MKEESRNYIDGFVLPIPSNQLKTYKEVAKKVAEIWKEYGVLAYYEYVGDDLHLEGTRSFLNDGDAKQDLSYNYVVTYKGEIKILRDRLHWTLEMSKEYYSQITK